MNKTIDHLSPFYQDELNSTPIINESLFKNYSSSKSKLDIKISKNITSFFDDIDYEFNNKIQNIYSTFQQENKFFSNYLLFGQVQSGKTKFMMGLMFKFLETKRTFFLFLSNSNNSLREQTKKRVTNEIRKYNHTYLLTNWSFSEHIYQIENKDTEIKNFLCFSIKEKNNLERIIEFIKDVLIKENRIDQVIIFDDEADVASLNNIKVDEQTTINKKLEQIKELLNSCQKKLLYFPVTATPYKHVLVNLNDFLRPQKVFVLKPGKNYFGLSEFYNYSELNIEKKPIVLINQDNENESLEEALEEYLNQCVLYSLRIDKQPKPRMLVNNSQSKEKHSSIKIQLNKILSKIEEKIKKSTRVYYSNFKNNFLPVSPWEVNYSKIDDYEKFNHYLLENIYPKINIRVVNSDNIEENQELFLDRENYNEFQIIIGSNQIQRGITIKDLTTSYLTRRADKTCADSVFQMCRFFGYYKDIFPICRVFLVKKLKEDIINLNKINQYFINRFSQLENSDNDFRSLVQYVPSDNETLLPTQETINRFEFYNCTVYNPSLFNNTYNSSLNLSASNATNLLHKCQSDNYYEFKNPQELFEFLKIDTPKKQEQWFKESFYENKNNFSKHIMMTFFDSNLPVKVRYLKSIINQDSDFRDRKLNKDCTEAVFSWELSNIEKDKEWVLDILPLSIWWEREDEDSDEDNCDNYIHTYRLKLSIPYCLQDNKISTGFNVDND